MMLSQSISAKAPDKNVVSMVATLKASVDASNEKQKALERNLERAQSWSARWKALCHSLQGSKADMALDIMDGQEVLLGLLQALEAFVIDGASVKLEGGKIAFIVDDEEKVAKLSEVITETRAVVAENIEILARSFPKVSDVDIDHLVPHLKLVPRDDHEEDKS